MRDIGIGETNRKLDEEGERVLGVIHSLGLNRNKVYIIHGGDNPLDIDAVNSIKVVEVIPFARWRVVAVGAFWIEASTANEDPIIEFGYAGDPDAYGKMTAAITGGEKFNANDSIKYDPLELLAPELIAEISATFVVTWTQGAEFGVWNTVMKNLIISEAAVAGMTSGKVRPYIVIEVDARGKW